MALPTLPTLLNPGANSKPFAVPACISMLAMLAVLAMLAM
jgi:hypothetical protein